MHSMALTDLSNMGLERFASYLNATNQNIEQADQPDSTGRHANLYVGLFPSPREPDQREVTAARGGLDHRANRGWHGGQHVNGCAASDLPVNAGPRNLSDGRSGRR
jgi:hypothetical protein